MSCQVKHRQRLAHEVIPRWRTDTSCGSVVLARDRPPRARTPAMIGAVNDTRAGPRRGLPAVENPPLHATRAVKTAHAKTRENPKPDASEEFAPAPRERLFRCADSPHASPMAPLATTGSRHDLHGKVGEGRQGD